MRLPPKVSLVFAFSVSLASVLYPADPIQTPPPGALARNTSSPGELLDSQSAARVRRPVARRMPPPRSVWVSLEYDATHDGWGRTHFATIQDAIDAVVDCGKVYVDAGTYYEEVSITRCVSLLGQRAEVTVIDSRGLGSAITIEGTRDVMVSGFTLSGAGNGDGATISQSSDITIANNIVKGNQASGVRVSDSERAVIRDNQVHSNGENGIRLDLAVDCVVSFNNIDNTWPIMLAQSYRNLIRDNLVLGYPSGISLYSRSDNNRIVRNSIIDGGCTPIRSIWSSHNQFLENRITRGRWGIYLGYSEKSIIANNRIDDVHDGDAISLYHASDCHVLNNTIASPRFGGITLFGDSSRNIVRGNSLSGGWRGISVFYESNENQITGNRVSSAQHGVIIDAATGNLLHRNNFVGNTHQGYDNGTNAWSVGGEGNYWSDHQASDAGGDGIGDRPRIIPPKGEDLYPLISDVEIASAQIPSLEPTPFERERPTQLWFDDQRNWMDANLETPGFTIGNGGRLTIQNSTVTFVGSDWLGIVVEPGGTLEILNSLIYADGKEIWIKKGCTFRMEDSELIRPGNWEGGGGLGVSADNAIVRNNLIRDSWSVGIDNSSSNSVFSGNTIENSYEGIASAFGHPENVTVTDNIIRNVIKRGIFLEGLRNATVTGNTVENCWGEPIEVSTESNVQANSFTSNTFVNYRNHPFSEGNNIWHDVQKGNYWGDYLDQFPTANCSTGDPGVWDTPYKIGTGGNEDPFPLVCPLNGAGDPVTPSAPNLGSPTSSSTTSSTDVGLSWEPEEGATEYRVQVSQYVSFSQPVVNTCGITSESYQATNLDPYTTYYWRVLAMIDGCHGPWSEAWTFTTGPAGR